VAFYMSARPAEAALSEGGSSSSKDNKTEMKISVTEFFGYRVGEIPILHRDRPRVLNRGSPSRANPTTSTGTARVRAGTSTKQPQRTARGWRDTRPERANGEPGHIQGTQPAIEKP